MYLRSLSMRDSSRSSMTLLPVRHEVHYVAIIARVAHKVPLSNKNQVNTKLRKNDMCVYYKLDTFQCSMRLCHTQRGSFTGIYNSYMDYCV